MQEEDSRPMKQSDSPIIKRLFSVRNQLSDTISNFNQLENQFCRIDKALQSEPSATELKKSQSFDEMTLSEKISVIDDMSAELFSISARLNGKFQQWL